MNSQRRDLGFTLIELIVTIIILGILAVGTTEILSVGFSALWVNHDTAAAEWRGNTVLDWIVRESRTIAHTNDILAATANRLRFRNLERTAILYRLDGDQLKRNDQVLADNISDIVFWYYDRDGVRITSPNSSRDQIRYLMVGVVVKYGLVTTVQRNAVVHLWNLK